MGKRDVRNATLFIKSGYNVGKRASEFPKEPLPSLIPKLLAMLAREPLLLVLVSSGANITVHL
jgi:hypothetical protein